MQNSKKLMANLIYERTIMVLFNGSENEVARTANLSCHPIRQLYDPQKSVQPDPVSQRHSCEYDLCDDLLLRFSDELTF